jgi:hypothetical protein
MLSLIALTPHIQSGKTIRIGTQIILAHLDKPLEIKHDSPVHDKKIQQPFLVNLFFAYHTGADGVMVGVAVFIWH